MSGQQQLTVRYGAADRVSIVGLHNMDDGPAEEVIAIVRKSVGSMDETRVVIFDQRGVAIWQSPVYSALVGVAVADLNRDRTLEVVVDYFRSDYGTTRGRLNVQVYTFPYSKAVNAMPAAQPGYALGNTNHTDVAFIRGDVNHDGRVDIADGQSVKDHVTCLSAAPGCEQPNSLQCKVNQGLCYVYPNCDDAMDANDDGVKDLKDADFINRFQLLGGARPPYPGASLGVDPTSDRLGCEAY